MHFTDYEEKMVWLVMHSACVETLKKGLIMIYWVGGNTRFEQLIFFISE